MQKTKENRPTLILDGNSLKLNDVLVVARNNYFDIKIAKESVQKINTSRDWVEQIQKTGIPIVYGINTGFGSLATESISKENLKILQRNLIMSHSAGLGEPLAIEVVRAAMLLRANTLVKGYSGIRLTTIQTLLNMLIRGVAPWIPQQGSVGASGDLAPLSHLALVLSKSPQGDPKKNSGKAYFFNKNSHQWELLDGWQAMKLAQIPRIILEAKEGLALTNGTQISTALLATTLFDAIKLANNADIVMAMSFEALRGISSAFHTRLHQLRPHPGQIKTAKNIRLLTANSALIDSDPHKIQDGYSVRCFPQVMSGVRDTFDFIQKLVEIEMNATTDNPIICLDLAGENKSISGGNFHAQPIAFASDFLSIVLCEMGNISERRIFRLSDKNLNNGLPSFLTENRGLESGLMIAQYTASALASENKSYAFPASVDSIPTCENQEDHVSMAPIAARKAQMILQNVQKIIAIEMIYAAQALDLRLNKHRKSKQKSKASDILGKGTRIAFNKIRERIPFLSHDLPVYPLMEKAVEMIKNNVLCEEIEIEIGGCK